MWKRQIDFLDEHYGLCLVLFSIISAAVFQYFTFVISWYYVNPSPEMRDEIVYLSSAIMRRLFLPILFSISFWFLSMRSDRQRDRLDRVVFKLNSWIQLSLSMFYMLRSFIIFIGNPLIPTNGNIIALIAAIPTLYLIISITRDYMEKNPKLNNLVLFWLFLAINIVVLIFIEFYAISETPLEVWLKIIGKV